MTVLILMWKLYNEWRIWTEILEEEDIRGKTEEEKWDYFRGVSIEHDW